MDITVRPITEEEVPMFRRQMSRGFGDDISEEDEKDTSRFTDHVSVERTRCAFEGDLMVGTLAWFDLDVSVPGGGTLPMAGTTMVTVQPTHRRRGVLRSMMAAHLEAVRSAGVPLAGLWASESSIYARFGYGVAADMASIELDARQVEFAADPPEVAILLVDGDEARGSLPAVYERLRAQRPGMISRDDQWWHWRFFDDPERWRRGRSANRFAVARSAVGIDGYAIFRQEQEWSDFPKGKVHVTEVAAATPVAHEALWRFLTRVDLFPNVAYWNLPVDDELRWRITDPRRVRPKLSDSEWIRILDVSAALAARRYAVDGTVRLGIADAMYPEAGTYELTVVDGAAECTPVSAPPDVSLSVADLAAIYLGSRRLPMLVRSGRIEGSEPALRRTAAMFAWDPAPWCPEVY